MARFFVLGAGFSRHAGLPLGRELFGHVLTEARQTRLYGNILKPDLERFCNFKEQTEGVTVTEDNVDAEEFVSFLDVEHFLRLKGDVYAEEGDRSQQVVKNLIAKVILSRQQQATPAQWAPYVAFAGRLQPYDTVITFNYDTLLETALDRAGVPYRLVPDRFAEVNATGATHKTPETEVVVLKVHGSIDWFDISFGERSRAQLAELPWPTRDFPPIFTDPVLFEPTPIVSEPYLVDSHLRRIRRIKNLDTYLSKAQFVFEAPLILAPSYQKLLYSDPLKELWWGMDSAGALNESVAVVGFSLPAHDQYAVQAVCALVRNFQNCDTGDSIRKARLRILDWCPSVAERRQLEQRYRFVDWTRAELDGDGFRPDAIPFLFPDMGVV